MRKASLGFRRRFLFLVYQINHHSEITKPLKLKLTTYAAYFTERISKKTNYKGAISDYNKVIELDPKDEYAFNNRGCAKSKVR